MTYTDEELQAIETKVKVLRHMMDQCADLANLLKAEHPELGLNIQLRSRENKLTRKWEYQSTCLVTASICTTRTF